MLGDAKDDMSIKLMLIDLMMMMIKEYAEVQWDTEMIKTGFQISAPTRETIIIQVKCRNVRDLQNKV